MTDPDASNPTSCPIERRLLRFALDGFLHEQVLHVLRALPAAVREDLLHDPAFVLYDYEPGPNAVMRVPVGVPGVNGGSRSVVLKRTLRRRPMGFVRWVIAHELAHAHLRNQGRWAGDDPEHAADALAAEWGFPRPAKPG
ncbi:MAG: hypothetical protein ACODAQ_04580 [Phycisphaeraceae bacterium]